MRHLFSIFVLISTMVASLLIMSSCGSTNSDNVSTLNPSQGNAQQVQQTPTQEFMAKMNKVDEVAFTLQVKASKPKQTPVGQIKYDSKFTQKNLNFRVDYYQNNGGKCEADAGSSYYIYDSQKKQIAGVDCSGTKGTTTGWKRPVKDGKDRDLDVRQNVIFGAILVDIGTFNNINWSPNDLVDVKKEDEDTFSFKYADWSKERHYIDFNGPEDLPSRLYIKLPAYGSSPEEVTPVLEFNYSNINQIPDSAFELSNLEISQSSENSHSPMSLCPSWSQIDKYCSTNG